MRLSLVWRQRCFDHADEVKKWADMKDFMSVEEVLDKFRVDMRARKILKEDEAAPSGMDLAMTILSNYVVYPVDKTSGVVPFNYCMASRVAPKVLQGPLKAILSIFCD